MTGCAFVLDRSTSGIAIDAQAAGNGDGRVGGVSGSCSVPSSPCARRGPGRWCGVRCSACAHQRARGPALPRPELRWNAPPRSRLGGRWCGSTPERSRIASESLPEVATVNVAAAFPSTVVITLTERAASATSRAAARFTWSIGPAASSDTVATRASWLAAVPGRRWSAGPGQRGGRPPPRRARCPGRFFRGLPPSRPTIRRESHSCSVTIGSCGGGAGPQFPTKRASLPPCAGPVRDRLRRQRPRPRSTPGESPAHRFRPPR